MLSESDILAFYVRRAQTTPPTKGPMDDPVRFSKFLKTLPIYQQKFDSFFKEGYLREKVFDELWSCKDSNKSPGAPLYFDHTTNSALEPMKSEIYNAVTDRLNRLIVLGEHLYDNNIIGRPATNAERIQVVECGLADIMAVGLKSEGRKNGKPPRLISLASVVDNMVTRVGYHNLFIDMMNSEEKYMAARLDLITPTKTFERYDRLKAQGKLSTNDTRGWEYSFTEQDHWACMWADAYMLGLVDENRNLRKGASKSHFFFLVATTFVLVNRVMILPDGKLVLLPAGGMPSGAYITYVRNSIGRALLSYNVSWDAFGVPVGFCMTAGDDCKEASHDAHLPYGKFITDMETSEDVYEFCSTNFNDTGSYQLNIEKSAYNLLIEGRFGEEDLAAFELTYKNHPEYEVVLAQLKQQAGF